MSLTTERDVAPYDLCTALHKARVVALISLIDLSTLKSMDKGTLEINSSWIMVSYNIIMRKSKISRSPHALALYCGLTGINWSNAIWAIKPNSNEHVKWSRDRMRLTSCWGMNACWSRPSYNHKFHQAGDSTKTGFKHFFQINLYPYKTVLYWQENTQLNEFHGQFQITNNELFYKGEKLV